MILIKNNSDMENIDWSSFNKKIKINTTLENVYKHWTIPELLCIWFLKAAEYTDPNGVVKGQNEQLKTNDSYTWKWHNYDGEEKGRIKEANGRDSIIFSFAGDTNVKVILEEKDNQVHLDLAQYDIPTDDATKFKIHCGCSNGWTFWLANLKAYLEHGILLHETESGSTNDKMSCGEYVNV